MAESIVHDTHSSAKGGHAGAPQKSFFGLLKRPGEGCHPVIDWLTTVDHKKIAIMYGAAALFFLVLGGVEALIIRWQLAGPEREMISARFYNQLFTMHGTTMIFLAVMPLGAAFFNYIMPLQIGARDVAFPRLNAFSLWVFLLGGVLLNLSWFFPGGAPPVGWFAYAPLTSSTYSPGIGTDFWVLSLQVLGISSLAAAFNFIATIINMRAPGLSMMRLPVFTWMTLITSFLIILAFPAITIALVQLMFDRNFGTFFFEAGEGGRPILWQHLFWIFGHPEVYILILPAMGIISEVLPVFARKPLFGYPIIVFSGAVIGVLGFAVWSHHMFTTGLGVIALSAFALLTMLIAIPTGVKIFNWIGTLWGGRIRFDTPMLFAIGFISMFMIGGFTGIMHASVPVDTQQHDTYFVVAHFHYVLIGGSIMALLAGIYYWFPKVSGKQLSERWGKISFWLVLAGFNLAFFPMHFLGMTGMPRRTHTYRADMGWTEWNVWSTVGAFILGLGMAIFVGQIIYTAWKGRRCKADPWDSRTLEWATTSPPQAYNFPRTPIVKTRDQVWADKYDSEEIHLEWGPEEEHGIHMPDRSWYPLFAGIGLFIFALGWVLFKEPVPFIPGFANFLHLQVVGFSLLMLSIYLWALEGPGGYHLHPDKSKDPYA